ncbi:transposase [Belnapia sp. F-4-1]|uniref:transposase n=1 Tax=Belnapia sp. F-4-1 TaxID=1545443 RepID=UPI0009DDA924
MLHAHQNRRINASFQSNLAIPQRPNRRSSQPDQWVGSCSGPTTYSALAIATALALRQTEGLIGSILQLLGLDLAVPDHSTLSRRGETLEVARPRCGREPVHLLVDSTGLQLRGPGGMAGGEAWQQAAAGVANAPPRHRRRHGPDRRLGADRQGCR